MACKQNLFALNLTCSCASVIGIIDLLTWDKLWNKLSDWASCVHTGGPFTSLQWQKLVLVFGVKVKKNKKQKWCCIQYWVVFRFLEKRINSTTVISFSKHRWIVFSKMLLFYYLNFEDIHHEYILFVHSPAFSICSWWNAASLANLIFTMWLLAA